MKVSVLIPHYRTAKLTAACIWHYKKYPIPVEHELIICDNSPDHWSIKAITETELGAGVAVVPGRKGFYSHAEGYHQAYQVATGRWVFTSESDSWPVKDGWFEPYLDASYAYDFIGPEMPMGSGLFVHPAGALVNYKVIEAALNWQYNNKQWVFVPSGAVALGTSNKPYHVVCNEAFLAGKSLPHDLIEQIALWNPVGVWQEQRSFNEDSFDTYNKRTDANFTPDREWYNRIAWEPGQHLHYLSKHLGFKILKISTEINWMPGRDGKQAEYSTVFGGFKHLWAGTVASVAQLDEPVMALKRRQIEDAYAKLPEKIRNQIEKLEHDNPA